MVTVLFDSVRRWWQAGAGGQSGLGLSVAGPALPVRRTIALRRVTPRAPALTRRLPAKPLTPFGALVRIRTPSAMPASAGVPVGMDGTSPSSGRRAACRFWMTVDPQDRRHAALGGSFAQVCAALEQLAAQEERRL